MDTVFTILLQGTGLDFWSFALLCAVSFFGSFITATLGLGGGLLTLTTMAMFLAPSVLIPVHGAVQLGSNVGRATMMHKHVLRKIVPMFLFGTILGALIGGQLVITLPVAFLQIVLALFVLYAVWVPRFQAKKPSQKVFFWVAAISSFVTMFVGATGPLVAPFVKAVSCTRQQMVATHAVFMTLQHLLKLIVFGVLGFAFGPFIPLLVGLILFGFAGTYIGGHTLNRLPENVFQIGLKIILTAMAIRLIYHAIF